MNKLIILIKKAKKREPSFEKELEQLINQHSKENESNTPDFILAQYLKRCFEIYAETVKARDNWFVGDQPINPTVVQIPINLYNK